MIVHIHPSPARPIPAIEALVAEHGLSRVVLGLAGVVLGRLKRPRRADCSALSPHLRRDVGLPPEAAPRPYLPFRL